MRKAGSGAGAGVVGWRWGTRPRGRNRPPTAPESPSSCGVSLDGLLETRRRLVADIPSRLDEKARAFLLSLHDGTPGFDVAERPWAQSGLPLI